MNRLQARNQHAFRRILRQRKLVGSVTLNTGLLIDVEPLDWEDYWCGCRPFSKQLATLRKGWGDLIDHGHRPERHGCYVSAYFALLKSCLRSVVRGEATETMLRKVVGFESFPIRDVEGRSLAATLSSRNPAYLLGKLAQPKVFDDPKLLPLICPFSDASEPVRLHSHYRRISLAGEANTQLFVYPPVRHQHESDSHALIGRLFKSLTHKNDPWVKMRSEALYDSVLAGLFEQCSHDEPRILDVACGSARLTVELCKRAYARNPRPFDLTLIDVSRSNKSLARSFYRNLSIFRKFIFKQESLFDWVDQHDGDETDRFDLVLMLRVLDVFSRFQIEELSHLEASMLLRRDRQNMTLDSRVLAPSELIDAGLQQQIQHSIKRTRLRRGSMFYQFSLSDYFKAIRLLTGSKVDESDEMVYVPVRRFDDSALKLPSGRSLIAQLMEMADRIIIEDVDLTLHHLREHFRHFDIESLRATDVTDRRRMRGASVILVERKV